MTDVTNLPKTRSEALKQGSTRYFTGLPCKHGHLAPRHTYNLTCVMCTKVATTEAEKRKRREYMEAKAAREAAEAAK